MARKCTKWGRGKGGRKVCRKYSGTKSKAKGGKSSNRKCAGLGKSGKKKGKLLKGFTWKGATKGGCPRKVA
jgi:hypothetical protein